MASSSWEVLSPVYATLHLPSSGFDLVVNPKLGQWHWGLLSNRQQFAGGAIEATSTISLEQACARAAAPAYAWLAARCDSLAVAALNPVEFVYVAKHEE